MNSKLHKLISPVRKFSSGWLLIMGILLLVVSCPLKRILKDSFGTTSSLKAYQSKVKDKSAGSYVDNNSCYGLKEDAVQAAGNANNQKVPLPLFLSVDNSHQGFTIPYLLNGISGLSGRTLNTAYSNLPLFLCHQRLLI